LRPDGAASGAFDVPRARGGSFSLVTIRGAWPYPAVILCILRGVSRQSWPLLEDGVLYQEINMPQWLKYFLLLLALLLIASVALGWWKYTMR
jgi:hypothetical protein